MNLNIFFKINDKRYLERRIILDLIQNSNLTTWYNKLNAIRQKNKIALGTLTVPSKQNELVKADDMNTLINSINSLKTNKWFSYANWDDQPATVIAEKIIESITSENVTDQLSNLDLVCANVVTSCQTTKNTTLSFTQTTFSTASNSKTTTNKTTSNITNNIGNTTESNRSSTSKFTRTFSDRFACSAGVCQATCTQTFSGNNNTGFGTECRTTTNSTTTDSNTSNSTSTSFNRTSNFSTTTNSTYNYNFSVVSGQSQVNNSRTQE